MQTLQPGWVQVPFQPGPAHLFVEEVYYWKVHAYDSNPLALLLLLSQGIRTDEPVCQAVWNMFGGAVSF